VQLAPAWPKGHNRRALALIGAGRWAEAICAYERFLKLAHNPQVAERLEELKRDLYKPRFETRAERSAEDLLDPMAASQEFVRNMIWAREVIVSPDASMLQLRKALEAHIIKFPGPNFEPKRRYLLIPSPDQPAGGPRNIEIGPEDAAMNNLEKKMKELLGCDDIATETLYSDDHAEQLRGNTDGVGIGYFYHLWSAYMDDNGNNRRRYNPLASRLLHRPNTHGPVAVVKILCLKWQESAMQILDSQAPTEAIGWKLLTLEELESDEWRKMREEMKFLVDRNKVDLANYFTSIGATFVDLGGGR